ncbi:hypothetical protein N9034_00680 [bacterium]|nr:hypothetical protein [bacterium]MDB4489677.1 hypothetical protein [bacterium]
MKLNQLKTIVKEAVKEAIQEEMKDILMEAVRAPRQTVVERITATPSTDPGTPSPLNPVMQTSLPETDKLKLRENMMSVLDGMRPGVNGTISANTNSMPLQMGSMDTTSPNGQLPQGEVSMDMINNIMKGKV